MGCLITIEASLSWTGIKKKKKKSEGNKEISHVGTRRETAEKNNVKSIACSTAYQ